MNNDILQQLVSAARAGEGPLLDKVEQIDPSHHKYLVAALVMTKVEHRSEVRSDAHLAGWRSELKPWFGMPSVRWAAPGETFV